MYQNIAIIEDDATLRRIIARNLRARGHLVREIATGAEAVSVLERERPDLILLDINLPDLSGWEVLRELQTRGISVNTVVMSAVEASPSRLGEFRPLAYLRKPFALKALLRLAHSELNASRLENVDKHEPVAERAS